MVWLEESKAYSKRNSKGKTLTDDLWLIKKKVCSWILRWAKSNNWQIYVHVCAILYIYMRNQIMSEELVTHTRYVPRRLIWCMRSYLFMGVSNVRVREMALALLTRTSMPPNCLTALSTALLTDPSSLTSTTQGSAWPPAASTKKHRKKSATCWCWFLSQKFSSRSSACHLHSANISEPPICLLRKFISARNSTLAVPNLDLPNATKPLLIFLLNYFCILEGSSRVNQTKGKMSNHCYL